jgi:hypothetical protein
MTHTQPPAHSALVIMTVVICHCVRLALPAAANLGTSASWQQSLLKSVCCFPSGCEVIRWVQFQPSMAVLDNFLNFVLHKS